MALAPVRLLGPMRAVDSRSSHSRLSAAATSSYGSSIHTRRSSLLFLLHHRSRLSSSLQFRQQQPVLYPTHSSNSRYDSRSMHKAPWEQGPAATRGGAAGRSNRSKETKQQHLPNNRVAVLRDQVEEEGASIDEEGGGGKVAMARIVDKLRSIQNNSPLGDLNPQPRQSLTANSVFLPRPGQPVFLGVNKGWSTPDHPIPEPATDSIEDQQGRRLRFPWEANSVDEEDSDEETTEQKKKVRPPTMAELTIPVDELKRLRGLGLMVRRRLKIGRLGVTPGIIEAIHNAWKNSEIVKVKCEGPPAINMRKTHQALERGTGGLVIWRAGSAAVVYRGKDYVPPSVREMQEKEEQERKALMSLDPEEGEGAAGSSTTQATAVDLSGLEEIKSEAELEEEAELKAMEDVLEGLGPRWVNWTGNRPVPIDGDLLLSPDAVCKRPFRLLPYGLKAKLTDFELTDLRRFARPLPPHFVLGRNRGLSGLAAAIVKLWEKTEVVKIAVKRGVQNTNNELMAEELKALTGGTLLARDKEFITLYRGKDFLPQAVQAALQERDSITKALQEEEERARGRSRSTTMELADAPSENSTTGTLAETLEAKAAWESWQNSEERRKMLVAARKAKRAQAANRIERRVNLAIQKKERAERELAKVEHFMNPADAPVDREHITEEERYMFRKLGLRMKAYLLVGRRGVFDGVVENMHLHWKHRELVKIIIKGSLGEVEKTAKMLEIESGGILVGIVTTSKGQAIIMYRGKNYQRPSELRPRHLLTKRQALKRSLELQRKASLEKHILTLEKEIEAMKLGLETMQGLDEEILNQWGEEDFSDDEGETDRKEDNELEETLKSERRLHSAGNHPQAEEES
ncbi:unnamed protein product [Sphagnum jensenii]|uniref:CRM domain-containing protein n=1 Tax=Sphagnum jensenii TaxID=128206 RepID=A0ABP0VKL3_9BRYO